MITFPHLFLPLCPTHLYRLKKSKESTARAVLHREFGIRGVYTIEASFLGGDSGRFKVKIGVHTYLSLRVRSFRFRIMHASDLLSRFLLFAGIAQGLHYTIRDYERFGVELCHGEYLFVDSLSRLHANMMIGTFITICLWQVAQVIGT